MSAAVSVFGPDFPFAYDDWLSHKSGLGSLDPSKMGTRVAVVGAGVSGMVTAYELMRLGLEPVLFEAGRMGGRLRSEHFPNTGDVVAELGGMRFPESAKTFNHYVALAGLETKPFPNPLTPAALSTVVDLAGETLYAETADELPQIYKDVAAAWQQALDEEVSFQPLQKAIKNRDSAGIKAIWDPLVHEWDDRTFYDFISTSKAFRQLSFRHREIFGQVGFGTGGWDSDFRNTMLEILRVVLTACDDNQSLIVGGAEQLPRTLWQCKPEDIQHWPPGTSLQSLHQGATRGAVTAIKRSGTNAFDVTDQYNNTQHFSAVVVCCQSWLLTTSINTDESLFSQAHWMALDRTSYMQSSKTFVMVDEAFWTQRDAKTGRYPMSMTLTDRLTRGTYLFDNGPDRPGVICLTYTWMADAFVGHPITVSWEADENFLGAFKGALPGHYRYNRRMYTHFFQKSFPSSQTGIFIAGDDVSWTPGWAEGAVQTALNAVWGVLNHLGGQTNDHNPGPGDQFETLQPVELPE